ncbi:MAG TPA: helix-hairpin-helix domain-containing protein [Acidimicrobiia bacterium]|jgi:competence protein ComEA
MEWHEVVARARARLEGAPARTRVRAISSVLLVVVLVVGVLAFVAARSGSAASPAGAAGANAYPPSSAGASRSPSAPATGSASTTASSIAPVIVSVAGAVVRPGVVTLPFGARVVDAITAAGGARGDADPNALDLAAKLVDGVRVYVPKVGEHVSPMPAGSTGDTSGGSGGGGGSDGGGAGAAAPSGPVDLNTASEAELEALPGIGPSLAQAIITTRTRLGGFRSVDELREVRGIGDRRFADLQPLVTV